MGYIYIFYDIALILNSFLFTQPRARFLVYNRVSPDLCLGPSSGNYLDSVQDLGFFRLTWRSAERQRSVH